jgi:hypothetical protein
MSPDAKVAQGGGMDRHMAQARALECRAQAISGDRAAVAWGAVRVRKHEILRAHRTGELPPAQHAHQLGR